MSPTRHLVLILALLAPAASHAGSAREAAQALIREGNAFLDQQACAEALQRFRRALAFYPEGYRIHVNLGSAYECTGNLPAAVTQFELFLLRAEPRRDQRMIGELRARFDRARVRVGSVRLTCPVEGATVVVDDVVVGRTPLLHGIYVKPGRYLLRVAAPGRPAWERTVVLPAGSLKEVRVNLEETPPALVAPVPEQPPPPPQRGSTPVYKRWWFWTLIGVGVAGATTGIVLGVRGSGDGLPSGEAGTIDLGRR